MSKKHVSEREFREALSSVLDAITFMFSTGDRQRLVEATGAAKALLARPEPINLLKKDGSPSGVHIDIKPRPEPEPNHSENSTAPSDLMPPPPHCSKPWECRNEPR